MDKISVIPLNPATLGEEEYLSRVIYAAYRQCYSKGTADGLMYNGKHIKDIYKFIQTCMDKGHLSPLEHISVTFAINGVSRVLTHQLVRHRLASYSQQSQRYNQLDIDGDSNSYLELSDFIYLPDSVLDVVNNNNAVYNAVAGIYVLYDYLIKNSGISKEDARYILPSGTRTNIVMTANLRSWMQICNQRLCGSAQDEIREVIGLVGTKLITMFPFLEGFIGPKCIRAEKCLDGKNKGELCEEHYAWRDEPWGFE